MTRYGLHGKLTANPGKGRALADILLEAARLVRDANGCHIYVVSLDDAEPDSVWVTEVWDSKEDHDASLSLPSVRALIGKAMPLLADSPEKGQTLRVLGGAGLD